MKATVFSVKPPHKCGTVGSILGRIKWERFAFPALYTGIYLALTQTGPGFRIPYYSFQLLPKRALEEHLGESLLYLHAQPPAMNALLGIVLHASRILGVSAESIFLVLHFFLGLVIVSTFKRMVESLVPSPTAQRIATLFLVLHPVLYIHIFIFSYTVYEIFLLLLLVWFADCFWKDVSVKNLIFTCGVLSALTLTRSVFHPIWSMSILLCVFLGVPRTLRSAVMKRKHLAVAAITVPILLLWPLKNLMIFDFFGYSSWRGYNLSRSLPIQRHELTEMFSLKTKFDRTEATTKAAELVPERFEGIYVLSTPTKEHGVPNWNHYAMLFYSRDLQRLALDLIRARPARFFRKAWWNYRARYTMFSGRNLYSGKFSLRGHGPGMGRWMRVYESILFLNLTDNPKGNPVTVFSFVFPLIVLAAAAKLLWRAALGSSDWRCAALLLLSILWVLFLIMFVDGDEGNRIRFSTEPLIVLLLAWVLARPWPKRRSVQTANETT